jgi:sugar lactone lactonase YvrE
VPEGYRAVAADGGVFDYGADAYVGDPRDKKGPALSGRAVALLDTPDGLGYWLVSSTGQVLAYGDAPAVPGRKPASPVVAAASDPVRPGVWLTDARGHVYALGAATYYGGLTAPRPSAPIVAVVATPDGHGYWLVGRDAKVYAFGGAPTRSVPRRPAAPIVAATAGLAGSRLGLWLLGADGGVFALGAGFYGSLPAQGIKVRDAVGIALAPDAKGYWAATANGVVHAFGDARFLGDFPIDVAARVTGPRLVAPWVGLAAAPAPATAPEVVPPPTAPAPTAPPATVPATPVPTATTASTTTAATTTTTATTATTATTTATATTTTATATTTTATTAAPTTTTALLLVAPTALVATPGNSLVALNWSASPGATSYQVYQSTGSGYSPVPSTDGGRPTSTSTVVSGLGDGSTYSFEVVAEATGTTSSAPSSSVNATPYSMYLSVYAGTGARGAPTPGPATGSALSDPASVAVDSSGNLYIADLANNVIEKVTPAGQLSIVAGTGSAGAPTPGPALRSDLYYPDGIAVDGSGNLYIADSRNNVIEKVTPAGQLSIVAGSGVLGPPTAGPATGSDLHDPNGIAVDSSGNLYIADRANNVIEKVTPAGQLSIVAGTGSAGAPTPGPALRSDLSYPIGIAVDSSGNLFIADSGNNVIEKVTPAGQLSIVAGSGVLGPPTAGPATGSDLHDPNGIAVDISGNLFIADSGNGDIEEVTPAGQLSIVAGTGSTGGGLPTPGPATSSGLGLPLGLVVDSSGSVFVGDYGGNVVEKLAAALPVPTSLFAAPSNAEVVLDWSASPGATSYQVYQSTGSGYSPVGAPDGGQPTSASTAVRGLTNGTTYSFEVVAEAPNAAPSPPSSAVNATPALPV